MSKRFPELDRVRVSVGDEVRERHLAAIVDELRSARTVGPRRFRLFAVTVALVLALPVIALASEDAVPGDALYPIKRMLEPVVSLLDGDVAVDHRVREAEILLERDAEPQVIRDHVERARNVVTDEHPEHLARLDVVAEHLSDDSDREVETDHPASSPTDDDPGDETEGDPVSGDRPAQSDRPVDSDEEIEHRQTTTTTTPPDTTTTPRDGRGDG